MERLDKILSDFETTFTRGYQPKGDEREGMVLPERMAATDDIERVLADLAAKYRDKPLPKLSDELRKKLGVGIPEIK